MKVIGIIPARMAATRFPGKPLAKICGRPMIEHVYRRASLSKVLSEVYLATCDRDIFEATLAFGGRPVMTADTHVRCTDRVAEAAEQIGTDADVVVNIQGDEPLLRPEAIDLLCAPMLHDPELESANLVVPFETEVEFQNRNVPKAVCDRNGYILYISREAIPSLWRGGKVPMVGQTGVIAFRRDFLAKFARLEPTPLEAVESVDMLRALEHGHRIKAVPFGVRAPMVDMPEDLVKAEALMRTDPLAITLGMNGAA
jgi:3-deoxy-manno-octulosonate cytidylyltransferase (CMP-KDO synthetase)